MSDIQIDFYFWGVVRVWKLEVVRIFSCDQIFIYNPEFNEDNHLTQIEWKNFLLPILANPQAADLLWCGLD